MDNDIKNADGVLKPQEAVEESISAEESKVYTPPKTNVSSDPTVTFDSVDAVKEKSGNMTGLKVFFTLIAVSVMLIISVSVGYIFGSGSLNFGNKANSGGISTQLSGKGDLEVSKYSEIFKNTAPSVVHITVYNSSGTSSASGVIYTTDGYIVTNDHIYSEISSPRFIVTLNDGTEYEAVFVAGDTRSDLAVLKINATGLKSAVFGNSAELVTGEQVIAVGFPSGSGVEPIPTAGIISSNGTRVTNNSSYNMKMIQTDTAINPGSSGGALVNMYSQVVGITSAKLVGTAYDSVGYAIPSATVVKIVDSLINNGYVVGRGKLGINYYSIDTAQSKINGVPKGLQIESVSTESKLLGKVNKGDIITHINDVEIVRNDVALDIIDSTAPGVSMSFTVYHPSTKTSETVYAALIPDKGDSSYTNQVANDNGSFSDSNNPFDDNDDDSFSDH
jgi:serine protease Do